MIRLGKIALILALVFLARYEALSIDLETRYTDCRNAYRELTNSKKKEMRHNWIRVVKCFEEIAQDGSGQKRAVDALFTLGVIYKHLYTYSSVESDLNNALRYFGDVAERYPDSSLADDGLYSRARIFFHDKGEYAKAYLELSELYEKYPESDSAKKARALFAQIKSSKLKDYEIKAPRLQAEATPKAQAAGAKPKVAVINGIKHWTNPNYTRVAIYLDNKAGYNFNTLDVDEKNLMPRRLYVDIEGSSISQAIGGRIPIRDGLLTMARVGTPSPGISRVVLDAEKEFDYNVFAWEEPFRIIIDIRSKDSKEAPERTVVDLSSQEKSKLPEVEPETEIRRAPKVSEPVKKEHVSKAQPEQKPAKSAQMQSTKKVALAATPVAKRSQEYIKRIVIDPGHGGHDTGAVGKNGTMEKDIVLAIAKKLRDKLSKEPDIEVIMTREEDVFVPLEERTGMAVQAEADLFISIHADAHRDGKVSGVSTYFLGDTDDKDSIMTALKENYSTSDYIGGIKSQETKDLLSYTFVSLQKNYDAIRSVPLADSIQKEILTSLKKNFDSVKNRGVRKGIFWVLCGTNSPAVLVETSYISNPMEESRLKSDKYQDLLATGIAKGITSYLENPVAMSGYDYVKGKSQAR